MKNHPFIRSSRPLYLLAGLLLLSVQLLCACGSTAPEGTLSSPPAATMAPSSAGSPAAAEDTDTTFTLLVYMIGSDLESVDGAASSDIAELLAAKPSGNLRVLLQTGGAERWYTEGISADKLQRHEIKGSSLTLCEELPNAQASLPETLHDFLSWGLQYAPADRYAVILWDHGGGATLGYGLDDYYPEATLSLADLHTAFEGLPAHFDFIGFDACLMGTMETALAFSPYADYLIASEEFEPSTGWFYTDWVSALAQNPSIPAKDLGISIVDDFVSEKNAGPYDFCTLALIDLQKIPALYDSVREWYQGYYSSFDDKFARLSNLRSRVKSFGGGNYEQVDLMDLLLSSEGVPEELKKDASEAVVHAAHNKTVDKAAGLSLYYPYLHPEQYDPTAGSMTKTGFATDYFAYYDSFVTTIEYMQLKRAQEEKLHDAHGLVEDAGLLNTGTASSGTSEETQAPETEPPALDPEDLRFREYIKIHDVSPEEEELVSDVRLMQLNPTDSGYIYVGKEGGGPVENGTNADLSGGHYLSIEDTLVSFELVYDSTYPEESLTPGESENTEAEQESPGEAGEPETTSSSEENEPETTASSSAEPETASAAQESTEASGESEGGQKDFGDLNITFSTISANPDPGSGFSAFIHSIKIANDLTGEEGTGETGEEDSGETGEESSEEEERTSEPERPDDWFRFGYVDAVLNGDQYVDLMVVWDNEHPEGHVAGYRPIPEEAVPFDSNALYMPHRGLEQLETGDKLHFYFHHFDEDGRYDGIVFLDDPVVCGEAPLETGHCKKPFQHMKPGTLVMFAGDYILLGEGDAIITYRITDVYNNIYYVRANDVWEEDDIIRIDTEHPEESWEEIARKLGLPSQPGNGPENGPGNPPALGPDGAAPESGRADNTAAVNAPAPTQPAAQTPEPLPQQETAAAAEPAPETAAQQQEALPGGSYTVIGSNTGGNENTAPAYSEFTDEEIDAFFYGNDDEGDPDDDDPSERPTAARPAETQAQPAPEETKAPAETQAQTETEASPAAAPVYGTIAGSDGTDDLVNFDDFDLDGIPDTP